MFFWSSISVDVRHGCLSRRVAFLFIPSLCNYSPAPRRGGRLGRKQQLTRQSECLKEKSNEPSVFSARDLLRADDCARRSPRVRQSDLGSISGFVKDPSGCHGSERKSDGEQPKRSRTSGHDERVRILHHHEHPAGHVLHVAWRPPGSRSSKAPATSWIPAQR